MGLFEGFIRFFQTEMPEPALYGWFHLLWFGIMIGACVLVYVFRKRISPKAVANILLVMGITVIVLEIIKQLIYSFEFDADGNLVFDFQTYAFPFQFCSTPMYLMLLAGILRKGRVYDALLSYLATFALIGGLLVMIYPGDVYISTIFINIQTMILHAGMVVIAFLLFVTRSVQFNYKTLLKAGIVFVCMLLIALTMNIIAHFIVPDETFNMFFIGPYYPCTLPILSMIYPLVPWVLFFVLYVVGFSLAAGIVLSVAILCDKLSQRFAKNKTQSIKP